MRKTIKHKVYSIEEKNMIAKLYLSGEKNLLGIVREYDVCSKSTFLRWVKWVREAGTVLDRRGTASKPKNRGRPKKLKVEEMSHEELVHYVRLHEDIKKSMAYLRKRKTNTK